MNVIDMPIRCSNCKKLVDEGQIFKTDSEKGFIGECCSYLWGDIEISELED